MMVLIYCLPLSVILLFMTMAVTIWKEVDSALSPYPRAILGWKHTNLLLALLSIGLVFYSTVFTRTTDVREINLIPFHFISRIPTDNEAIRTVLMNLFLFFPLGLTAGRGLREKCSPGKRVLLITLFGVLLSATVEILQYTYSLGRVEADDLIANTAGALIGALALAIGEKRKESGMVN